MTRSEVAPAARVCSRSIDRAVADGSLPSVRVGRRVLIRPEHFADWFRSSPAWARQLV
jgi:excisionase family DNA binding protein